MFTAFGTQGSQVRILPLRPDFIRFFRLFSILGQADHRFDHRNIPTLLANRSRRALQIVGVMVAIGVLQDLRGHAQEPGGFPDRHAPLHQPGRGGVAKRMWCRRYGRP